MQLSGQNEENNREELILVCHHILNHDYKGNGVAGHTIEGHAKLSKEKKMIMMIDIVCLILDIYNATDIQRHDRNIQRLLKQHCA